MRQMQVTNEDTHVHCTLVILQVAPYCHTGVDCWEPDCGLPSWNHQISRGVRHENGRGSEGLYYETHREGKEWSYQALTVIISEHGLLPLSLRFVPHCVLRYCMFSMSSRVGSACISLILCLSSSSFLLCSSSCFCTCKS